MRLFDRIRLARKKRKSYDYSIEYYYDDRLDPKKTEHFSAPYQDEIRKYPDKCPAGYEVNRLENWPLQVQDVEPENVIQVHYRRASFEYSINYFRDSISDSSLIKSYRETALYGCLVKVDINSFVPEGYSAPGHSDKKDIRIVSEPTQNVANVVFTKGTFPYKVEYYYDGFLFPSETDIYMATNQEIVDHIDGKPMIGYERVEVHNIPLHVSSDDTKNVIRVFYRKAQCRYTINYFIDSVGPNNLLGRDEGVEGWSSIIQIDKCKYLPMGYDVPDKGESDCITIMEDPTQNVSNVVYRKSEFVFSVEYYYDDQLDAGKTETNQAEYRDEISTFPDKNVDGFEQKRTENFPLIISSNEEENTIRVYYEKKPCSCSEESNERNILPDEQDAAWTEATTHIEKAINQGYESHDPVAYIADGILGNLNHYQMQAILDESPACLVNACVGSGKTTVLIAKIFFLHNVKNIPLRNMVVLTFTNKAADEIKERLRTSDEAVKDVDMPYFGTFHSVALKMLKTILPLTELGYTADFTVIDEDEEYVLATRLMMAKKLNIKYSNKLIIRLEKVMQGENLYGNMKYEDQISQLYYLLKQEEFRQNKMNFDDLLAAASALLPMTDFHPEWILVDEFQDCDDRQIEFLRALTGPATRVLAVGDPNQIIYSWRGSSKDIFRRFQTEYNAIELSLPLNYRSCKTILAAAKCFTDEQNVLTGVRESGKMIAIKNHYDPFDEAQYLADRIKDIVDAGAQYRDIGILYRMQMQSQLLEDTFKKVGIPFAVSLRKTLNDIPVLAWFLRVLRSAVNSKDEESALFVLRHDIYGERFKTVEAQDILAGVSGRPSALLSHIRGFAAAAPQIHDAGELFAYFDLNRYICPTSSSFEQDKTYITKLLADIGKFTSEKHLGIFDGVKEYIDSAALYGLNFLRDNADEEADTVKLMTLHAAKGLEFKYVFIIGVNQGLLPLQGKAAENEKEERRLFFVGITRAKDELEISYYSNPSVSYVLPRPSEYLYMIPNQLVTWELGTRAAYFKEAPIAESKGETLQSLRKKLMQSRTNSEQIDIFQQLFAKEATEKTVLQKTSASDELESTSEAAELTEPISGPTSEKKAYARHQRYGVGVVVQQDDKTITVRFEGYGDKQFLKMFCEVSLMP